MIVITLVILDLFGDSRQLYPYELASISNDNNSLITFVDAVPTGTPSDEHPSTLDGSPITRSSSSIYPTTSYFPVFENRSDSDVSCSNYLKPPSTTARRLYFAPDHILPTLPGSSPTWAPITKVFSPLVCREQRDTVLAAAGISFIVLLLTAAICFSG